MPHVPSELLLKGSKEEQRDYVFYLAVGNYRLKVGAGRPGCVCVPVATWGVLARCMCLCTCGLRVPLLFTCACVAVKGVGVMLDLGGKREREGVAGAQPAWRCCVGGEVIISQAYHPQQSGGAVGGLYSPG